jgi:hypothetical protein
MARAAPALRATVGTVLAGDGRSLEQSISVTASIAKT